MTVEPEERTRRIAIIESSLRFLLEHPDQHIGQRFATDEDGRNVSAHSPAACRWCAVGRIAKEADVFPHEISLFLAPLGIDANQVAGINDRHTMKGDKKAAIAELHNYMLS